MFPEAAPYPPPAAGHWVQMILPWARVMTQCHQPGPLSIQRAGWREACNLKVNQPNQQKHSNQNTQARLLMLHHGFFIFQNRNISIYIVLVVRLLGATWPERADLASCARCKNTKPWRWNCQKQRCRDQSYIIYPININQMISTSTVE